MMSSNLEDDSEEEWAIESCLAMIQPVEEAKEEEAMLLVLKEIEEKMSENMGKHFGKDQFTITDELKSFEDKGEPERKPSLEYANAIVTEDDNIQEPSTYEKNQWKKKFKHGILCQSRRM